MRCDKCGSDAVLCQKYSGQHLCREHVITDVETKAKREIRSHHGLRSGDHIAIALFENDRDYALLIFLKKLTAQRRDVRISAIIIDEGTAGTPDTGHAVKMAESEGVPSHVGSFNEAFGITLDEIAREKGLVVSRQYRTVLCRTLLHRIARDHGCTRIVYGLTLDDRALDVLEQMITGAVEQMIVPHRTPGEFLPAIAPFRQVPEEEVRMYAELQGGKCTPAFDSPHSDSLHDTLKTMLEAYDHNHPATRFALINLRENLVSAGSKHMDGVEMCPDCGGLCTAGVCENCRIRGEFKGDHCT
jgi:tRNA(Ile)-lysidine synthase TilS/MesJ